MSDDLLKDAFKNIIKDSIVNSFVGIVKSVDQEKKTIEVEYDEQTFFDVKLQAIVKAFNKEIVVIPTVDSPVLCIPEGDSKERFVVVKYSMIDKVQITIDKQSVLMDSEGMKLNADGQTLDINKDGFVFNGGSLGGMIKIKELTDNLDKLTKRVDNIYDGLSKLTPDPPQTGSGGLTTGLKAIVSPAKEDFSSIEDDKIKH